MRTYLKDQLERFLAAVDASLDEPFEIVVIGGTAAALHYGVKHPTRDIDTWNSLSASFLEAVKKAAELTGLEVPVVKSGVAEAPYDFESRLERVLDHLTRLTVRVPEKHDLVIMKTLRAEQHDLDAIAEIHSNSPLDLEVLVERFQEETHPVGDPRRLRGNLLAVVERLFPDSVESVARRLKADGR